MRCSVQRHQHAICLFGSVRFDPLGPCRPPFGPELPAAVAVGDDEDVGKGVPSGSVSEGTGKAMTI